MSGATVTLAFAVDGQPVRLQTPSQWRAAIARGDLTSQTRVVVEEAGEEVYAGPAAEMALLTDLFPRPEPAPPEPEPDPDLAETPMPASATTVAPPLPPQIQVARPPSPPPPPPLAVKATPKPPSRPSPPITPPPRPKGKARWNLTPVGCFWMIGGGLLLLILIGRCSDQFGGQRATRYVEITTPAMTDPDGGNSGVALRGEEVTVLLPNSDADWLKVVDGRLKGAFLAADALSANPRPTLRVTGGPRRVRGRGVRLRSEPDGPVVGTLAEGASVQQIGIAANEWAEISHDGGVAYIHTDYLRVTRR